MSDVKPGDYVVYATPPPAHGEVESVAEAWQRRRRVEALVIAVEDGHAHVREPEGKPYQLWSAPVDSVRVTRRASWVKVPDTTAVAARYAELPSLQEEYDLWAARLNELVVLDGRVGRLTGVHHKANIGVELVVHCTEPHPEELPCRRTGWSLDVAMAEQ